MNNLKVSLALFATLFIAFQANSQILNKFGVSLTSDEYSRVSVDYSRATEIDRYLNFRLSYGGRSVNTNYERKIVTSDAPEVNDYLSNKTIFKSTDIIKLAVGPEYRIRESKFSWGMEGVLGAGNYSQTLSEGILSADDYGILEEEGSMFIHPFENETVLENVDHTIVSSGIQGRLSLNSEITPNLGLQLFVSSSIEYEYTANTRRSSSNITSELRNENNATLNLNTRIGATFYFSKG